MSEERRRAALAAMLAQGANAGGVMSAFPPQPRMSPMVDLGDFNNPPPAPMAPPPPVDQFNMAEPLPTPPPQMPVPLPRRAPAAPGGMTADDLNNMSLMLAQGYMQPDNYNDAQKAAWANIDARMKA